MCFSDKITCHISLFFQVLTSRLSVSTPYIHGGLQIYALDIASSGFARIWRKAPCVPAARKNCVFSCEVSVVMTFKNHTNSCSLQMILKLHLFRPLNQWIVAQRHEQECLSVARRNLWGRPWGIAHTQSHTWPHLSHQCGRRPWVEFILFVSWSHLVINQDDLFHTLTPP